MTQFIFIISPGNHGQSFLVVVDETKKGIEKHPFKRKTLRLAIINGVT